MALLRVEHGVGAPYELEIAKDPFTIGRAFTCDLHLKNPWLSRLHARIIRRDGAHILADLGSRNGTYLNGRFLREEQGLEHGDLIALGDLRLRFLAPPKGSLHVADSDAPLEGQGTVFINSTELVFDRYREATKPGRTVADSGDSLLPALNAAASALITYHPLPELVELVIQLVLDAVPAERAALMLRTAKGELEIQATRGYGSGEDVRISRTIIEAVLGNQKAVMALDAQTDDRFGRSDSIMLQGIHSIICVPLWNNRDVIGLVYLDHRSSARVFSENALRLVGLIANMAAVKIENVRLLEEQLEKKRLEEQLAVGAQIQRKLLPDADPELAGYDIRGINQSSYDIGGDYYDFIWKEDGRLAIVVADVSGKGIGAALLMAVLQASLRALIHTAEDPAQLVRQLNRVLVENSPYNKFATLIYGELDPERHTLAFVNGGHNPGLLLNGRKLRELGSTGPIVGLIAGADFRCDEVEFDPGATLLLYTDGITERFDEDGNELGSDGLAALLEINRGRNATDLMQVIQARLDAMPENEIAVDDSTVVVVRREES